jgi:ubiquinone/menaquinone biosynthesis C-methylase UbiE
MRNALTKILRRAAAFTFPTAYKRRQELAYWTGRYSAENQTLRNGHFETLYTTVYGLTRGDYEGKAVLDIGCGPGGSLEWADMTKRRVGLDPLAPEYLKLGADRHRMEYCAAPSERIPYENGAFDIVTCLNALDHVDDFDKTVCEIKRVTRTGGLFLLSTEIDHPPTDLEPVTISIEKLRSFRPEFDVLSERVVGTPPDHDLHGAVVSGVPAYEAGMPGIYVAKMRRA